MAIASADARAARKWNFNKQGSQKTQNARQHQTSKKPKKPKMKKIKTKNLSDGDRKRGRPRRAKMQFQ